MGKGGSGLSCPFSKIGKKCPNFAQKCPDCGICGLQNTSGGCFWNYFDETLLNILLHGPEDFSVKTSQ